jgi:hypothetical protein
VSPVRASLAARNAVATAILDALDDRSGTALLTAAIDVLGAGATRPPRVLAERLVASGLVERLGDADEADEVRLRPELVPHRASALARLRRGRAAAVRLHGARDAHETAVPQQSPASRLDAAVTDRCATAIAQAIVLWETGLFFEVHEVLERLWHEVEGELRLFLQGVIQIAAAFHHLETGNRGGARTLLAAGRGKLVPFASGFAGVDVAALLGGVERWTAALAGDDPVPDDLSPPALIHARATGVTPGRA